MWIDPLTALGVLSIPFLVSNSLTFFFFVLAAFFSWEYTKEFYGDRKKPISWILMLLGLSIICLSEFGQTIMPYNINPSGTFIWSVLIIQSAGMLLLAVGALMLYVEVR